MRSRRLRVAGKAGDRYIMSMQEKIISLDAIKSSLALAIKKIQDDIEHPKELIPREITFICHPDDKEKVQQALESIGFAGKHYY